jgi:hypothetical protein
MFRQAIFASFLALILASIGHGGVIIMLELPHDDQSVRDNAPRSLWAEQNRLVEWVEKRLVRGCETKDAMIRRFGEPVTPKLESIARPLGGNWIVSPEGIRYHDLKGLDKRCEYFQIGRRAVLLVFFASDGHAYHPGYLYFLVDSDFVPLTEQADIGPRSKWESARMKKLFREVALDEAEWETAKSNK